MAATEEIRGVGHSVKRMEDARFIRGKGNYFDDITLPGMLHLEFLRSPYAHARITSIDTSARRGASRASSPSSPASCSRSTTSPGCRPSRATRRPCSRPTRSASRGRRSRRSSPSPPYIAKDALRAHRRRLRAARGDHDPAAGARRRRARHPRREGRADRQPHLRLGGRRQGGDRQGLRRGRQGRRARHLLPALPSGAARVLRLRRGRQPGDGQGDDLHDVAGPARPPDALRARGRPARAQDPDHLAGPGRRLRQQGADLPGLRRRHGGLAPDRPARQVGRGPHREPHLDRLRPRLPHARRAGAQGRAGSPASA